MKAVSQLLVAILFNAFEPRKGRDAEACSVRAVEVAAAEARDALAGQGCRVKLVPLRRSIAELFDWLKANAPDVVVNLCEEFRGKSGHEAAVAGLLEMLDLPFTGCSARALFLCHDKFLTKLVLRAHGLPVPAGWLVGSSGELPADLPFPLIVKPGAEDGSLGISPQSVVADRPALCRQVDHLIATQAQPALVEVFIAGREFNVAIIDNPAPQVLPIAEVAFDGFAADLPRIVGYDAKWNKRHATYKQTMPICPADLPKPKVERLRRIALDAYRILKLRGYARIDFRADAQGQLFVLEVNPNPDTSRDAGLPRMLAAAGIAYGEFWRSQVQLALRAGRSPT